MKLRRIHVIGLSLLFAIGLALMVLSTTEVIAQPWMALGITLLYPFGCLAIQELLYAFLPPAQRWKSTWQLTPMQRLMRSIKALR